MYIFNFWCEYRSWPWQMHKRNFWYVKVQGHTWHIADHVRMAFSLFTVSNNQVCFSADHTFVLPHNMHALLIFFLWILPPTWTLTMTIRPDLNIWMQTSVPNINAKVTLFKSYCLDRQTHKTDQLLYQDHKVICNNKWRSMKNVDGSRKQMDLQPK